MKYTLLASPLGQLTVSTDGQSITGLHIASDRYFSVVPDEWILDHSIPILQQAKVELTEYFAGRRLSFTLPCQTSGTVFQQQVWAALQAIVPGSTSTYGSIAAYIGKPSAVRAVGTAVGRNPICIVIPCHRVLSSQGGLGGYVAGLDRKQQLLRLEGYEP